MYTFPSPEAFKAIKRKVKALTRHTHTSVPLKQLLYQLTTPPGWTNYCASRGRTRKNQEEVSLNGVAA